jgi:plastocyanin
MNAKKVLFGILFSLLFGSQTGWAETVEVKIIKSTFIPAVIKVKKGDTIRWINTEELLHTVTSGKAPMADKEFNAAYVKKEFEVRLDKEGFYDYYCELHPAIMRGVVIVRASPGGSER